jgi:hypothetical protein
MNAPVAHSSEPRNLKEQEIEMGICVFCGSNCGKNELYLRRSLEEACCRSQCAPWATPETDLHPIPQQVLKPILRALETSGKNLAMYVHGMQQSA